MANRLPHDHGQDIDKILANMPETDDFITVAEAFQKLGDGTRLRIFWLLCHSEQCVCNIAAAVGMSNPAVSHHLRILKEGHLISGRRVGKEVYYSAVKTKTAELLHRSIDSMFEITCPTD